MSDIDGWQIPLFYSSPETEIAAARAGIGLADLSALVKIRLVGRCIDDLWRTLVSDKLGLDPRSVGYFVADGPVLACRLREDELWLLAATTTIPELQTRLASLKKLSQMLQDNITSAYAGFCLVGPVVEDLLRGITALDVGPDGLSANACAETNVLGVPTLLVCSSELSLPSIRLYASWDLAEYVWEKLIDLGRAWRLSPLGFQAWRCLLTYYPEAWAGSITDVRI